MPAIKTVIYLDVLLLVNFLVAYFLLQAAGLLSSQHAAFSRMVCASGIASLSALILFAPELSYPAQILYKILTACAVVGVAFGLQGLRRFVTAVCWYAALNILLAGLCIAVILRKSSNRRQDASIDEPLNTDSDGNELLLMDVLTSDQAQVGEELERNAERSALLAAVQALNPRERQIMELRFGLRDGVEHTQKEVADSIGISQSYISRLEKRIIKRLRQQIESLV